MKQVSRNHIVNNLVEVYLKKHPDRRRPINELKELDNKNKVKAEIVSSLFDVWPIKPHS